MTCTVAQSIAIHADEPEQLCANELFQALNAGGGIGIKGEILFYDEILEMLDDDEYENADNNEISKMFIDKIAELIG